MAVVTPLNNFSGPEGDTVTADKHYSILNTRKPTQLVSVLGKFWWRVIGCWTTTEFRVYQNRSDNR